MPPTYQVAVLLYPLADILDFAGPTEIYSTTFPDPNPSPFVVTTFAQENPLPATKKSLVLVPHKTFAEMHKSLEQYDILVIPGAHPDPLMNLIPSEQGKEIQELIRCFLKLKPREETGKRILQSVCTGALWLAAAGILAGRSATTHHGTFDKLKQLADEAAGGDSGINVVRGRRWVDSGVTDAGVRIITAGGVSSGLDASLWIVEELLGKKNSDFVADVVEFQRRGEDDGWGAGK